MATQDRAIQGEGSQHSGAYYLDEGAGGDYDNLNSSDGDGSTLRIVTGGYNYNCYNMQDFSELGTINGVTLSIIARKEQGTVGIRLYVRIGNVNYPVADWAFLAAYTTYTKTWTTNPATGEAWTVDDINAAEWGFWTTQSTSPTLGVCRVTYQKITVDYTFITARSFGLIMG